MIAVKTKLNLYAQEKTSKPIIKLLPFGMIYVTNVLIGQNNQRRKLHDRRKRNTKISQVNRK